VVACVVTEGRRKAKRRVFQVMAMAVRQEYRGRGLARQAVQRVQARMRDPEEVKRAGQGHGGGAAGGYSLVAGLKSCMQRDGVGLYRALGWRGTGESWEWNSDEHATLEQISVLTEKPRRKKGRSQLQDVTEKTCRRKEQKVRQGRTTRRVSRREQRQTHGTCRCRRGSSS
jgi:hypothetical protein